MEKTIIQVLNNYEKQFIKIDYVEIVKGCNFSFYDNIGDKNLMQLYKVHYVSALYDYKEKTMTFYL